MCLRCGIQPGGPELAERAHVLQLLALVEHPDALPADAALRISREIMALVGPRRAPLRCEAVAPAGPDREEAS